MLLTFLFVTVAYAAQLIYPGHGDAAPLATGVALYGILSSGEGPERSWGRALTLPPPLPCMHSHTTRPLPACL